MVQDYTVIRSQRKTIAIQITPDRRIIVRAPMRMSKKVIHNFVVAKADWVQKHLSKVNSQNDSLQAFTNDELDALVTQAKYDIPQRVAYYVSIMGVAYGSVTIRKQVSRWGSCSSKRNLSFNCLLMLCPEDVRDYVVIHELCHLKHMNHSSAFWAQVSHYCPDYEDKRLWLRKNGTPLIQRLRSTK